MPIPGKAKGLILIDALRALLDARRRWDVEEAKPSPKSVTSSKRRTDGWEQPGQSGQRSHGSSDREVLCILKGLGEGQWSGHDRSWSCSCHSGRL